MQTLHDVLISTIIARYSTVGLSEGRKMRFFQCPVINDFDFICFVSFDRMGFRDLLRMTAADFEVLLKKVAPLITKKDTRMELAIAAHAKTLRFWALQHINIQPPAHGGSTFCCYKCWFSVQIMAVDAANPFRYVSMGPQSRACDAGIFAQMDFKRALDQGLLNIPTAKLPPGSASWIMTNGCPTILHQTELSSAPQ